MIPLGKLKRWKKIVATLGITGCGKSFWLKDKNPVVETDDLRVELLDDIDDLTQEGLIFSTAAKRMVKLFDTHDFVYFGATLVDSKYRLLFLQSIQDMYKYPIVIDLMIFRSDPEESKERIEKDLKAGVQRAKSIYLIDKQYSQYLHTIKLLESEKSFYQKLDYKKMVLLK